MTIRRPIGDQTQIEERTAELLIAIPRGAERAIRIARERWIINAAGEPLVKATSYVIGRLINDDLRAQKVTLNDGSSLTVAQIEEAIEMLADQWADEDAPIYGEGVQYLRPIT